MKQITLIFINNIRWKQQKIYTTKDDSTNKAHIVQLKNNRYAALKPFKNKFMRLEIMLKSFSRNELKEHIWNHIYKKDSNDSNDSNDTNNSNK